MGAFASWVKGRKTVASGVAIAVLAGVPLSLALLHQGFPVTDVDLNSRTVWVTNGEKLLGGRLNHQIGELDAKVNGSSSKLDVLQDGGATILTDTSQGSAQVIDPSFVSLTQKITIPTGAALAYGKDTLSILAADGKFWVLDASSRLVFDANKTAPTAKLGAGAQAVVSKSGIAFAVSPTLKKLYTIERPGTKATIASFPALDRFQLSAVGDTPIVLDTKSNSFVHADGSRTPLPKKAIRIQQAGQQNTYALFSSGDALLQAPLSGGNVRTLTAGIQTTLTSTQDVSAPVFLGGCSYGAWAGAQRYLYACDGRASQAQEIAQSTTGSRLEFRVNHGVIALNNLQNGNAWIVSSNMRLVNNWAQVNPDQVTKDGDTGKEKPVKQSFADALANRTSTNHAPVAVDDSFGVRPGRTTVLPVLSNDTDQDGDVLTITTVDPVPTEQGRVDVIDGGRSVQFTPSSAEVATASFRYTITDGRQAYSSAQVNVTTRPMTSNLPPIPVRSSTATVEVGQAITYNVLGDWIDPDGDDIYLVGAASTTSDLVQFTPDGRITFTSKTGQTGAKQVAFTVSDGRSTTTGTLEVDVKPADSLDPVATPDFATAITAAPVTIHPLENDLSPSGAPLSLVSAKLEFSDQATVAVDQARSTIAFQANSPGAYYLIYTIAAGSHTISGLVLVNVAQPAGNFDPPIAVKDIVYVRPGEPSTVNVLDNDVSPSGRVLAVQSVDTSVSAGALNVELLNNSVVRVTAPGVLPQQLQLIYTVSDGVKTATAGITVVPIPPLVNHQAPIATDDTASVRAGDVVSVHVLDNDTSPDNEPFTLDPVLADIAGAGPGAIAFVSGSLVRYQAPISAGTYSFGYGITDKFNQRATARVTLVVTPKNGDNNKAPEPQRLTARAFAGATIQIVVPLDGIDAEGDSVSLAGIDSPPRLGRITKTTPVSFTYEAYVDSAGTDSFTYKVEDSLGKIAIGTIDVGIIPRPSTVKPPTAVDDRVEVKPGKIAAVPVLLNDSDPNGYEISLQAKLPEVQSPLAAKVNGRVVLVTAPANEGAYIVQYRITNGHGGSATAFIQVIVTNDAKPTYPSAVDHVIDIQQLTDKRSVVVNPYEDALNPSGVATDLQVSVKGANAGAAAIGADGNIVVTPTDHRIAITYALTDETTGLAGQAFIIVPAKPGSAAASTAPPRVKPGFTGRIKMNGTIALPLSQIIDVPSGRPSKLTGAGSTRATNSDGTSSFVSLQAMTFTAAQDYRGPAAVTFKVNDGRDDGTTTDRITTLTLQITVGNADQSDVPPTFTPPNVEVTAGEAAQTIDLRDSTFHPNPAILSQVSFSGFSGATQEVAASPSGSSLTISSPLGVQPGTMATIRFAVIYREFTIPGSVNVRVVSSKRPLAAQKNAPQTADLKRNTVGGKTFSDAVGSQYWINPFPASPLLILDAKLASGPQGAVVSHTSNSITVTAGTAVPTGTVSVTYTVQDGTKDTTRNVTGQLNVTIHDVPDAPPAPSTVTADSGQAKIPISAPGDSHGLPVTQYEIESSPATSTGTVTTATEYTATGLTNGTAYRFRVRAFNSDGASAWSSYSAAVTPYATPSAPRNATITNTGGYAPTTLAMTWNAPSNTGGGTLEYSYSVDGGIFSNWQSGTSATQSANAGTHDFQVKARITERPARESIAASSNSVSVANAPPPVPSIALSAGNPSPAGTCSFGCHYYHWFASNFVPNTFFTVRYFCNGGQMSSTASYRTDGAGNITHDSDTGTTARNFCGFDGYVTFGGVASNTINMQ